MYVCMLCLNLNAECSKRDEEGQVLVSNNFHLLSECGEVRDLYVTLDPNVMERMA